MKNGIIQILRPIFLILLLTLMVCTMLFAIDLRMNASSLGSGLGQTAGALAGKAIGSFQGIQDGLKEGIEAGTEEGLSAKDTQASIANRIKEINNLEVLVASVKLTDFHTINNNVKYAVLYLANGTVVFSVDFREAEFAYDDMKNTLIITLPDPKAKVYIDQSSIEKVAEYQAKFFNGSAKKGFDAYINSMKELAEASAETIVGYESLLEKAKTAAENQIKLLAESASLSEVIVDVSFKSEGVTEND